MGLGGEVDDGVNVVGANGRGHVLPPADAAAHEGVTRVVLHRPQIVQIAGVGQLVVDDDTARLMLRQQVMDEVGADESRSARDEYVLQKGLHSPGSVGLAGRAATLPGAKLPPYCTCLLYTSRCV